MLTYLYCLPLLIILKSQIVATNLMDLFDSLSIVLGFGLTPLLLVLTLINRRRRAKNEVKKIKKTAKMLITVLIIIPSLTILLTGCWDSIDIEDRAYVIGIAIDEYPQLPQGIKK